MVFQKGNKIGNRFKKGCKPFKTSFKKGCKSWSKGLTKKDNPSLVSMANKIRKLKQGVKLPKKHCENISKGLKGKISWNKGKKLDRTKYPNMGHFQKHSEKTRILLKELSPFKLGHTPWNKGVTGDLSHSWMGGKSLEPYGIEFNKQLKAYIRWMDNYRCQECGYTERHLGYKLQIHHIDFNKKNNNINNLIGLCRSCHMQTLFNRQDWTNYFKDKIGGNFG